MTVARNYCGDAQAGMDASDAWVQLNTRSHSTEPIGMVRTATASFRMPTSCGPMSSDFHHRTISASDLDLHGVNLVRLVSKHLRALSNAMASMGMPNTLLALSRIQPRSSGGRELLIIDSRGLRRSTHIRVASSDSVEVFSESQSYLHNAALLRCSSTSPNARRSSTLNPATFMRFIIVWTG